MKLSQIVPAFATIAALGWVSISDGASPEHHMGTLPTETGQSAFAAITEIVAILGAEPDIDWSSIKVDSLREHLIDMNELTLRANAQKRPVSGGLQLTITGSSRGTLDAIQRMVPAHAAELDKISGWSAHAELIEHGVRLVVLAEHPESVAKIRGLGFMGLMATGGHHQAHHLEIARGELIHGHP